MTDFRTCRIKQLLLPPPCLSNELHVTLADSPLLAHSIEGRGYRQVITEHNWDIWGVGCDVTIYSRLSDEKTNFLFCVSEWNNFLVCNINHSCSCFRIKKNRLSSRFPVEHILRRFRCTTFKINISGFFSISVYARNRICFERSGAGNEKCFKDVMNTTVRIITDLDRTYVIKYCR